MSDMPPGGWPLRLAIFSLALPERRHVAAQCEALLSRGGDWKSQNVAHQLLWNDLVGRFNKSEIVVKGRPGGTAEVISVPPGLLDGASPDYDADSIRSGDLIFNNVRIVLAAGDALRSGVAGRPTSKTLWQAKLRERAANDELCQRVSEEARWLAAWLAQEHPHEARGRAQAIENDIRESFRELQKAPKTGP